MTAVAIVLSIAVLAICALCRPSRARCPVGYDLRTGIQRDGSFLCWPNLVGDPEWDGTWGRAPDRSVQPEGVVAARIYCGGAPPITGDDGRSVGCER